MLMFFFLHQQRSYLHLKLKLLSMDKWCMTSLWLEVSLGICQQCIVSMYVQCFTNYMRYASGTCSCWAHDVLLHLLLALANAITNHPMRTDHDDNGEEVKNNRPRKSPWWAVLVLSLGGWQIHSMMPVIFVIVNTLTTAISLDYFIGSSMTIVLIYEAITLEAMVFVCGCVSVLFVVKDSSSWSELAMRLDSQILRVYSAWLWSTRVVWGLASGPLCLVNRNNARHLIRNRTSSWVWTGPCSEK